jgi:hypothetical protein
VDALRRSANRPGVEEEYNYIKENLYMDEKTNIQLHGIWHILSEDEQKKIYNKKLWANLYYFFLTDKVFTEKTPVEILHDDDQPLYFDENRKKILSKREMARGTFTKFLEWQWLERYRYPSCEMDYIIEKIFSIIYKDHSLYKTKKILPPLELAPYGSTPDFKKMILLPWAGTGIEGNEILTPYEYFYTNYEEDYNKLLTVHGLMSKINIWKVIIHVITHQLKLHTKMHNQPKLPTSQSIAKIAEEAPKKEKEGEPVLPPPIRPKKKTVPGVGDKGVFQLYYAPIKEAYKIEQDKKESARKLAQSNKIQEERAKRLEERRQNSMQYQIMSGLNKFSSKFFGSKKPPKAKESAADISATVEFNGGKSKRKVSQVNKKDVLGKQRNIYKFVGDRKEYIKYKNEYVLLKKYKEMQKTKSKPKTKPKTKSKTKSKSKSKK